MNQAWRAAPVVTACLSVALAAILSGCGGAAMEEPVEEETPRGGGTGITYYVSPGGNDTGPGTAERPWASPGFGSRRLQAGDTMVITGGRYSLSSFEEDMIVPPPGSPGAWITIKGEEGDRPVLAGSGDLYAAIDISGASYLRIENLEITSDGGEGFREGISGVDGPVSHVTLEELYIHHLDEAAMDFRDVEDLRVTGCIMSYCGFGCMMGPEAEEGGWRDVLVEECVMSYSGHYYRGGPGPGPYDRPDGFGIEPSEGPIEISRTICEHNRGDGLDSKAANTRIHDCVVANNSCDGVKLWGDGSRVENTLIYGTGDGVGGSSPWAGLVLGGTPNARFEVFNVTIADNPAREAYPMYVEYEGENPTTVVMRNTVVSRGHGEAYFGDSVELLADHNIFFCPDCETQVHANGRDYTASDLAADELGEGNLYTDPGFVGPAWGSEGDYHLSAGSPAVDAGSPDGAPPEDLDGNPRPAGMGWDIGAYEYRPGRR